MKDWILPLKGRMWLGGIFTVLAGILFCGAVSELYNEHIIQSSWKATTGKILSVNVRDYRRKGRVMWAQIDMKYEYYLAGHKYIGSEIDFRGLELPAGEAQAIAARFSSGDVTVVYYDPLNPSSSLLDLSRSEARNFFFMGLFMMAVPVIVYARDVKKFRWAKALR